MILPEELERLRGVRESYRLRLMHAQAGWDDNTGGIRALHFPDSHPDAWRDAYADASLALTIMALDEAIAKLEGGLDAASR